MLPIFDIYEWYRLTERSRFGVRRTALDRGLLPLGSWIGTRGKGISPRSGTLVSLLFLSPLILILYGRVLGSMAQQWWSDPNYGHGFLVPLFAAYILWRERSRRTEISLRSNNWGLAIMFFAIGLLILGTLGSEHFTSRVSLIILVSGLVVFLAGWKALRSVAFPIGYLIFMIPLPAIIYYQLTFPLQLLASRLGANGLVALGVPTVREGNLLILPNVTLEVVEACSGVRSLLSLLAAAMGFVYLVEPSIWKRCIVVASALPIVIVSNAFRLVATGLLTYFFGPSAASSPVHTALGLMFFVFAFLSIIVVHRLVRRINTNPTPAMTL